MFQIFITSGAENYLHLLISFAERHDASLAFTNKNR